MASRRVTIAGRERIDPRETRSWRELRNRVIREEPICRLQVPGVCTQVSTTAAHIRPVSTHPELALERTNVQGACSECNEATGTTPREALRLGGDDADEPPALAVFR